MSKAIEQLQTQLQDILGERIAAVSVDLDEITLEIAPTQLLTVCRTLRSHADLAFTLLIDICGVDYSEYGVEEWQTDEATGQGFSRGVNAQSFARLQQQSEELSVEKPAETRRFAAVYHLLSISTNRRVRLRCYAPDEDLPVIPSVIGVWASANWYEREAFDLFGIIFEGHPDLRRILTDYGFIGHPFRKDFPLSGNVEVRYDAEKQRVVYEPVSIEPRVLVPKVIRDEVRRRGA
ncbi:MAG: NADH-quinone oxidoreductase subunit C [Gammaproteobacteria bacterium]|nr:NADH-quinone oxidoreductase subunit C [Gammaproteobacteria bacterium]